MTEVIKQGLSTNEAKRKLVSIQEIKDLEPIAKADKIEVASVLGWEAVVKKGQFTVGEKVVFFEVDSFLPDQDRYSFLGSSHRNPITIGTDHVEHGHRLSTVKLRGQLSQGLVMPLSEFGLNENIEVGTDVTEQLGVTKYEKPEVQTTFGRSLSDFPTWLVSKTDETRVQTEPHSYRNLINEPYYMTYKYDGTSITIAKITDEETKKPKLVVASRNKTLEEGSTVHEWLHENNLYDKLLNFPIDITLQGEMYGEGIQSNRLNIKGHRYAVFNIEVNKKRVPMIDMLNIVYLLGLEMVNIYEYGFECETYSSLYFREIERKINLINQSRTGTLFDSDYGNAKIHITHFRPHNFNYSIDELLHISSYTLYPDGTYAEGLVVRPLYPDQNKDSFKAINNNYLVEYNL